MADPAVVRRLHDAGRYREALAAAKRVLRIDPRHAETLLLASSSHCAQGHLRRALRYARRAATADPFDPDALLWLARVHACRGKLRPMRRAILAALALGPGNPAIHRESACLHLDVGRYRDAVEAAREALRIDAEDTAARDLLARALTRLGRHDEAAGVTRTTLREDPEHAPAHARLGWIGLAGGGEEALAHFREALRLDPTDADAREGLLHALRARHFLYRWSFRALFWLWSRPPRLRLAIIVGFWYGMGALVSAFEGTSLRNVLAFACLVGLVFLVWGHRVMPRLFDVLLRLDRRVVRYMKRDDILTADALLTVILVVCIALLRPPKPVAMTLTLAAFVASPLWHAVTWPNVPYRRRMRIVAALVPALPLAYGAVALVAFPGFALLFPVVLLLAWLVYLLYARELARRDGI